MINKTVKQVDTLQGCALSVPFAFGPMLTSTQVVVEVRVVDKTFVIQGWLLCIVFADDLKRVDVVQHVHSSPCIGLHLVLVGLDRGEVVLHNRYVFKRLSTGKKKRYMGTSVTPSRTCMLLVTFLLLKFVLVRMWSNFAVAILFILYVCRHLPSEWFSLVSALATLLHLYGAG